MKRWIIRICIAVLTLFTGVTVHFVALQAISFGPDATVKCAELPPPPTTKLVALPPPAPKPIAVINPEPVSPTFVLAYDPDEFNPRGDYFILGPKPKELREFDVFELVVEGWQGKAIGDATLSTKYFGNNPDYNITSGNGDYSIAGYVTKERLSFIATSKSPEDFQFIFEGHFFRGGTVSDARANEAVLRGTLTKLKRGVKVAESTVSFRVEYLGC